MPTGFSRGTGLLIINVVNSNPNGDFDAEGEPRSFDDGRGLISPVSFKRKLRDLVEMNGDVCAAAVAAIGQTRTIEILESRKDYQGQDRDRAKIYRMTQDEFNKKYWDGRVFGSTFLENLDEGTDSRGRASKKEKTGTSKISTGVVQFGPGLSISPVDITRLSFTNKAGVEEIKDRGAAPLAFRVVRHALYTMPFFVNPSAAGKTSCDTLDIDLLKFLIPHAYSHTRSLVRTQVDIEHAWYCEHKNSLGSCPDSLLIRALTPMRKDKEKVNEASLSIDDYDIPDSLPANLLDRLASFEDLCLKDWSKAKAA